MSLFNHDPTGNDFMKALKDSLNGLTCDYLALWIIFNRHPAPADFGEH